MGADWYDAISLPKSRLLFAIGDVAGHGLDAAVTMSHARQALISAALLDSDPADVLRRVNGELLRERAAMVTAVVGYADPETFEFVYSTAGHPPPLLIEPNRPPRMLRYGSLPLGVVPTATFRTNRIQTVPGATLVLYTDGAIEHSRDVLAGERLLIEAAAAAAKSAGDDVAAAIHRAIFEGRPGADDVAILTICLSAEIEANATAPVERSNANAAGVFGSESSAKVEPLASWRRRFRALPVGKAA